MKYFMNNYKGKHFVLCDEPDDIYGDIGTIDDKDITDMFLENHVEQCLWYGIPEYIGNNKELHKRIELARETIKSC